MNYIKEINAFRNYLKTHPIPAITQALWYVVIDYHNSCAWERWIAIDNSRLEAELMISKPTLITHRNKLIQNGLLQYQSQQKKKNSGRYKLLSFEMGEVNPTGKVTGKNILPERLPDLLPDALPDTLPDSLHINKLNEIKPIEEDEEQKELAAIVKFYNANIGRMMTPYQLEIIQTFIEDGIETGLVLEVMKDSVGKDEKWYWFKKVLNNCVFEKIFTVQQYSAKKLEKQHRKGDNRGGNKERSGKTASGFNVDFSVKPGEVIDVDDSDLI